MTRVHFTFAGHTGTFDGDEWVADSADVAELLRLHDAALPPAYFPTLADRVRAVFAAAGGGEITKANDGDNLPEGALP